MAIIGSIGHSVHFFVGKSGKCLRFTWSNKLRRNLETVKRFSIGTISAVSDRIRINFDFLFFFENALDQKP